MLHASLRRVGPVVGGADALLDALLDVVGPTGTLLMVLGSPDGQVYHPHSSPAHPDMGALAEVFRTRPGTEVNDHVVARYAASGPMGRDLLHPMPLHDYHGPGSPLQRLVDAGGVVLRLGANVETVTLTHLAEYLASFTPKRRVTRTYLRHDVGEQAIESRDDNDGVTEWPHGDYFAQILVDFVAAGFARTGKVGQCSAEVLDARTFLGFAVTWMEARL